LELKINRKEVKAWLGHGRIRRNGKARRENVPENLILKKLSATGIVSYRERKKPRELSSPRSSSRSAYGLNITHQTTQQNSFLITKP